MPVNTIGEAYLTTTNADDYLRTNHRMNYKFMNGKCVKEAVYICMCLFEWQNVGIQRWIVQLSKAWN